jgi:hypothetical protein
MLGVSERTFRRWRDRLRDEGPEGLRDRRIGKPSSRRAAADEILRMLGLYRELYAHFTVKHFHEQLVKRNLAAGLYGDQAASAPGRCRGGRRTARKRARRPMVGMLLHQDASRHAWLEGQPPLRSGGHPRRRHVRDLFGVPGRGGRHRLELARAGRGGCGEGLVLCPLHRPRQPLFPYTGGGRQSVANAADQVGRALSQLGIEHIAAYSPEARGRSERVFRTLQDRLPKELRLAGITGIEAANRRLAAVYLPEHNARFAQPAAQDGSAFVADAAQAWREILCVPDDRQVGNDNTSPGSGCPCRSRRRRCARTSCAPRSASTNTRTAGRLLGTAPARRLRCRRPTDQRSCAGRLNRFGRQHGCGFVDVAAAIPTTPQPQPPQKRSIHALQKPVNLTRSLQVARGQAIAQFR